MRVPQRKPIKARSLSPQEQSWIREILAHNQRWADVDIGDAQVVAQCDCNTKNCKTVYLDSPLPQNSFTHSKGYLGRIEIMTVDDFLITVTLDQEDGKICELYVDFLDLHEPGNRIAPDQWQEKSHTVTPM